MSTTLLQLKRNIGAETGRIQLTPSAAGTTLTIVANGASSQLDPDDRAELLQNSWVEVEADSAVTPLNVSEIRRVSNYVPSTGTLTVSRAFTDATTTTMTIGVYPMLPPGASFGTERGILHYINSVLRTMRYRNLALLTLAPDGDMEASGTTNYTAVGTATLSKETTIATLGKQSLLVATTAASSGVTLQSSLSVTEGQVYDIVVDCRQASNTQTMTLQAYDVTNSTVIDSVSTTERAQRYLYVQVTIPDGCKQFNVRLLDDATGATYAYYDNLSIRHAHTREMSLPSWFDPQTCLFEELWVLGGGQQETDNDSYSVDERNWHRVRYWEVLEDRGGLTPYKVRFGELIPSGYHLVAQILRPYSELSADTDTTDAEPDAVKCFALANIWQDKQDEKKAQFWARRAHNLYQGPRPKVRGAKPLRDF